MGRDSLKLTRYFTREGFSPFKSVSWQRHELAGFESGVEAPAGWSETAVEIAALRYFRRESSVGQLVDRVVRTIRLAGEWQGYFSSSQQAQTFSDELAYVLLHQMASFNSPVYFNVGLFPIYGIMGKGESYVFDVNTNRVRLLQSAYVHPQASACFIQDVQDDLLSIFELLKNEAKLFKYGSGTGTNFSRLRAKGESLVLGGESTGLISYLEIFDKAAQAIRSGGTNRRAAKMVVLDADHPDVMEFICWKRDEERKARVLIHNGFSGGMDGEAYRTISGQNSNNSIRVTDAFLKKALANETWRLKARCGGAVARQIPAKELLRAMAQAAWECADPGIQYHDQIQRWHTCPNAGPIRASNPCSEYMFLDDSACNLASLNLVRFLRHDGLDWKGLAQTARLMLMAQDILVDYASYPTEAIAYNSHTFRPLGLGYANLGAMLMRLGIPYESPEGERWCAQITAGLQACALEVSQELAEHRGAFDGWQANREPALRVLEQHYQAWQERADSSVSWIGETFLRVLRKAEKSGLRNSQHTLIAPTGTIGLFMDCDTLGIEPDFSLVKRKILAGGGELRLVNHSVGPALRTLGYDEATTSAIVAHVAAHGTVMGAPGFNEAQHARVFDCALPPTGYLDRRISALGHLKIMAAAQPFLSGAISKTINLPAQATVEDVERIFLDGWRLGLKSVAIYRDGSKSLQPLCAEC